MAYFGYRLFQLELRQGNGRKPHPFESCAGEHFAVVAERLLKQMLGKIKLGVPTAPQDDEQPPVPSGEPDDRHGQAAFRVESVERLGHMLRGEVLYGRYGDFHKGVRDDDLEDVELDGVATTRRYRFLMNLPPTGTRGILAMEDISRTSPSVHLQRWLKKSSQDEGAAKVRNSREAKAAEAGVPSISSAVEDLANATWWRLHLTPAADEEFLRRLIQQGKLQRIELIKRGRSGSREADVRELELTAPNLDEGKMQAALEAVSEWAQAIWNPPSASTDDGDAATHKKVSDAQAAEQLAAVLGPHVTALEFDDGYVVIADADGKAKKISPSRLSDYFTYPLARDRQPSRLAFWQATRDTAKRVAVATKTANLDWSNV